MLNQEKKRIEIIYCFLIVVVMFVVVGVVKGASTNWKMSGSIPVPARLAPVVPDVVSPVSPRNVEVQGLLDKRIAAHMNGRILNIDEGILLGGFQKRPGSHPWIGEHVGKWLHAASFMYLWSGDSKLRKKIERVATGLMACQEKDGYSGTYVKGKRFGLFRGADWDVWVHKYCLIGLLSYWGISGNEKALECCRHIGDLLCRVFPKRRSIISAGTHVGMAATSILEPIVLLYRATGEKRYLDFARYIVKSWDEKNGPHILSAMLKEKTVLAVGNRKAYEMLSNYVGLCELYRGTGTNKYLEAAELAWQDVKSKRLYLTGSASSFEHFQPDGHLPNGAASHIQETCVTVTWLQLNWQLLRITGKERYADALEQTIFNELLGAQKPDGSGFGYYVPLVGKKPFSPDYPGTKGMDCCNSSGPRGLGITLTCIGCTDSEGFRINTFASARWTFKYKDVPVEIILKSKFPSEGNGTVIVRPEKELEFCLSLRIPRWAVTREVKVGNKIFHPEGGTYLQLRRRWKKGDTLTFNFPFRIDMHKGTGTNKGLVAFTAGPLVLALDKADNPDIRMLNYCVPDGDTPAACDFQPVAARKHRSWKGEIFWSGKFKNLFHQGKPLEFKGILRPFFDAGSWNSQYAVWIKAPGSTMSPDAVGPFLFGHEIYSRKGNHPGSIADGDPETFRVTYDATLQKEDFFGIEIKKPVRIGRVVYIAGRCFHDGGWFDTTVKKPWIEIKKTARGPWKKVAVLDKYPDTTNTNHGKVRMGLRVAVKFPPVEAVAIRVKGKPSCGDYPGQAFASCAEILVFEK